MFFDGRQTVGESFYLYHKHYKKRDIVWRFFNDGFPPRTTFSDGNPLLKDRQDENHQKNVWTVTNNPPSTNLVV